MSTERAFHHRHLCRKELSRRECQAMVIREPGHLILGPVAVGMAQDPADRALAEQEQEQGRAGEVAAQPSRYGRSCLQCRFLRKQ